MADPLASIKQARIDFLLRLEVAMSAALTQAAQLLMEEMELLTSLTDHSLEDLRALDHPYSWRHEAGGLHPDWETHRQNAGGPVLTESFYIDPARKKGKRIIVGIANSDPTLWYLLMGTERMRPRDFGTAAVIHLKEEIGTLIRAAHAIVHDSSRGYTGLDLTFKPIKHKRPAQLPGD